MQSRANWLNPRAWHIMPKRNGEEVSADIYRSCKFGSKSWNEGSAHVTANLLQFASGF
jgi:hypothetical protein